MSPQQNDILLQLSAEDNVYVLVRSLAPGTPLQISKHTVSFERPLELGHKIAARDIAASEKIIKYGVPIGSALRDIRLGEHVHLHNIKSDYIPTYTLDKEHSYVSVPGLST